MENYYNWAWNWIVNQLLIKEYLDVETVSAEQLATFIEKWKQAVVKLDNMIYEDAKKEFTLKSQTSFGIDGKDKTRISDFENVRGEFTNHPAVTEIIDHIDKKSKLAEKVINKLRNNKTPENVINRNKAISSNSNCTTIVVGESQ